MQGQNSRITAVGVFCVSWVAVHANHSFDFNATQTDLAARVAGLTDTFWIVVGFISTALLLRLLSCIRKRARLPGL